MPKKINVCFITEDFYPDFIGGQGIYGYHLTQELAKMGQQVTVLAEKRDEREKFWEQYNKDNKTFSIFEQIGRLRRFFLPSGKRGVSVDPSTEGTPGLPEVRKTSKRPLLARNAKVLLIPFCFSNQLLLALFEYLYFIFKLKNQQFDIVHANQLSGLFFALFKPSNVKKVIISAHNTNYDMNKTTNSFIKRILYLPLIFLEKIMYRHSDGLLFNSESEKNDLANYYSVKNKKLEVAYLGTPDIIFSPSERLKYRSQIRKKLGIKIDEKIVLYVGRIVKKKRVDNLIKALIILRNQGLKVTGIIIGRGNLLTSLSKNAPDFIKLLGFIHDAKPYFLASDIFVTTGVAEGGIALSALEAAHYALPLILSPDDSTVPILENGLNGYRADPNSPADIAAQILKVIPFCGKMGKESLKFAKLYTWKRTAGETANFYASLLRKT